MGGDLSAGCGRKSIAFSTPFEAALKIIAKGKWLHIIIATGLTPMAIFESNGLYDLLSLMRHDGIININRNGKFLQIVRPWIKNYQVLLL